MADAAGGEPTLLPARLHCAGGPVPQGAIVRVNAPACAFSVETARGRPLDIDLGQECAIVGVSTQGRHPPTRMFPRVAHEPTLGWLVEGQPDWPAGEKYRGP